MTHRQGLSSWSWLAWFIALMLALASGACDDNGGGDGDADGDVDDDGGGDGDADGDVDDDGEPPIPEDCNPLAPQWDCLLPYPSDVFLTSEGGERRIELPEAGLMHNNSNEPVDLTALHPYDGFPVMPSILALFPVAVDDGNLPFFTDEPAVSTGPDSPTVLLDAETGERVYHFAELDPRPEDDTRRALVIHPLTPLRFGTRYIVAVRGLVQTSGDPVEPPPGFAAIRDAATGDDERLTELAERYESEIFPVLDGADVARGELQLAWDFTTSTRENVIGDMLRARELALAELDASPPSVNIPAEGITDDVDEHIARRIEGTIEVPLYMETTEPGALLHRDAAGQVAQNGTAEVEFLMLIPRSVADDPGARPARLLQFGHGFFGTRAEADSEFVRELANRTGMVVVAVDWWGMSTPDRDVVGNDIMANTAEAMRFTDRVHQGMVNQIALTVAARTNLAAEDAALIEGAPVYDPDQIYYYGISMGHILGGTYLALAPHVERAALSVGGCGFSLIMFRSRSFATFFFLIEMVIDDPLDHQKFTALSQSALDRVDPSTYARFLVGEPLPGARADLPILIHGGLGDTQVPSVSTQLHARTLGASLLLPAPREVPGVPGVEGPLEGRALVEFDFGVEEPLPGTYADFPEESTEVHDSLRRLPASMDQIDAFFRPDGQIRNFCDGVCDPE